MESDTAKLYAMAGGVEEGDAVMLLVVEGVGVALGVALGVGLSDGKTHARSVNEPAPDPQNALVQEPPGAT